MKRITFILAILCLVPCFLWAASISTPASSAANGLASAISGYQKENQGRLPKEWKELEGKFISLETVENELGGSIENRFALLTSASVEMARPGKYEVFNGGRILAVSSPISEDRRGDGPGRYVIWKSTEGKIRSSWLYEEAVQGQFTKASIQLPNGPMQVQPSTLGADPNYILVKYAKEHFKNPDAPTAEELVRMKAHMAEKYGDKRSESQSATPQANSQPKHEFQPSVSGVKKSRLETIKDDSSWFLIMAGIVTTIGIGAFWLLRKPSA